MPCRDAKNKVLWRDMTCPACPYGPKNLTTITVVAGKGIIVKSMLLINVKVPLDHSGMICLQMLTL